jgi:hypothetical protein
MGDISIDLSDIRNLQKRVLRRFLKYHPKAKSETNWNSNPDNYKYLRQSIIDNTKTKDIGLRFLRSFFYDSIKKGKRTFRLSNINLLSIYAFDVEFLEYMTRGVEERQRKCFLYYAREDAEKVNNLEELNYSLFKKLDIDSATLQEILLQARNEEQEVHFYVSEFFLKNEKGATFLIEILNHNLFKFLFDLDIKFLFDESLKKNGDGNGYNIVTQNGQLNFIKFWKKEKEKFDKERNELLGLLNGEKTDIIKNKANIYKELTEVPFFITLKSLAEIQAMQLKESKDEEKIKPSRQKIDNFQPIINEMMHNTIPEPIDRIWEISYNDADLSPCNFLCVIGYEGFFKSQEESEMVKYFHLFNSKLREKNHGVVRLFTLPSTKVKSKGWASSLSLRRNKLLYEYLYVNILTEAETYLFLYDKNRIKHSNSILLYQDYVIRLNKTDRWEANHSILKGIHEKDITISEIYKQKDEAELYLAYPEDLYGVNQILRITQRNNAIRYFEDFRYRVEVFIKPNDDIEVIQITKENLKSIIPILGLNHLNNSDIEAIHQKVEARIRVKSSI